MADTGVPMRVVVVTIPQRRVAVQLPALGLADTDLARLARLIAVEELREEPELLEVRDDLGMRLA